MTDSSTLIMDVIGVIGGGRGPQLYQITPHVLGAIFWGSLSVVFRILYPGRRNSTDSLLLLSLTILFVTELSLAVTHLQAADGFYLPMPPLVAALLSALERLGGIVGRVLLSAAFLQIVLGQRELTVNYLKVAAGVIALVTLYELAPRWISLLGHDAINSAIKSAHIPYLSELPIILLYGFAIDRTLRSLRRIRWAVLIALASFLLDSILCMVIAGSENALANVLNPIRGHLQLWPIIFIAYVALRVRHVEGQRLEHGIQANERLEALGQLSSGIAHDFNNHLQIILGYTELAKTNRNLDMKQRLPLDRIEEAAESAGSLVNQLLAFSRGQPPKFTPIDPNEVITHVIPMLSRLLGPDIKLVQKLDLNTKKILADVPMIEQILINLIVNAKDAIAGNGVITIETRPLSSFDPNRHTGEAGYERTQLLVSDTGKGMDTETVRRVFEPFFTTKSIGKGTGLGLATVYSAVQKHNGQVFIKSEPGKYTRVYMEFPVCIEDSTPVEFSQITSKPTIACDETILLAEDETAIRDLTSTLLKGIGYNVLVARDGQHAINIMRTYKGNIDLCLFDVTMPVMSGYETYDRVAGEHPDMPVLFITGNTSRVAHVRSQLPHLQKPFSKQNLFAQIRTALEASISV
ncbi:MAG: ATP-binding protein [Granulosicoccus sp.]